MRAALADHPGQPGLDRRGQLVDVVAVQAQPGLQPQRVARAQAGRRHLRLRPAARRRAPRRGRPARKSRTRPRRCSRSGRPGRRCRATVDGGDAHERQRRRLRRQPAPAPRRPAGPAAPAGRGPACGIRLHRSGRSARRWAKSSVLAAGVDHQEQPVVAQIGDHQVVEDAAGLVGEQRVALPPGLQAGDVAGHQRLQRRGGAGAGAASPGPCARRRTAPPARGSAGARPARRRGSAPPARRSSRTAPASRSRRTAPCGRPARDAAHRAAWSAAVRRRIVGRCSRSTVRSATRSPAGDMPAGATPLCRGT